MSRTTNRNVKKKLDIKKEYPLPNEEKDKDSLLNSIKDKNKLTDDILHDKSVTRFILEEDILNLFPTSGTSTGSVSSFADDLEERSTKAVKAEYDLVERILYGEETYENYNHEFDQWTQNFKYLRIAGSGIKIPNNWKKPHDLFERETIAEHRDPIETLSPEDAFYNEMKTIIKETVIANILEDVVNCSEKSHSTVNSSSQRQKWKKRNSESSESHRSSKEKTSFIPVSNSFNSSRNKMYKQHPIVRSDISSARWQKSKEDTYDFPMVSSRSHKISNSKEKSTFTNTKKLNTQENKPFNLPPIKGHAFEADQQNKGFFLRSNSCNTYAKEMVQKKSSFRTSSSKLDS